MELDARLRHPECEGKPNIRLQVVQVSKCSSTSLKILGIDLDNQTKVNNQRSHENDSNVKTLIHAQIEGVWSRSPIVEHSTIHLVNPLFEEKTNTYTVSNSHGFLVIDPDSLLTCTLVASSLFCERKTWLNHIFLGAVGTNRAMLVGTLVHETFQYGVKNRIVDIDKLTEFLDEQLDNATTMLEIYSVEMHLKDIRIEAISYLKSVKEWIEKFVLADRRQPLTNDSNIEVKVIDVKDIEENVWSTKYGLKGKIDVTGLVRVHDKTTQRTSDKIIPLELKTGNPNLSASHAAQVSLYSMMIEDRYAETNQGFVIYLKDKAAMHNVALTHNIKRDLIQRRNQVNYHMKNHFFGPDMIDQPRLCSNCDRMTECILMSNIYTPGKLDHYQTLKSLEKQATGHLDGDFVQFFKKYHEKLASIMTGNGRIDKNGDCHKKTGSFWNYSSDEAELGGTGFGKLQITSKVSDKSNQTFITFRRHQKYSELSPDGEASDVLDRDSIESNGSHSSDSQKNVKKQKIMDYFKPVKRPSQSPLKAERKVLKPFNAKIENFSRCRVAISLDEEVGNMDSQNSTTAIAIGFISELERDYIVMKIYEGTMEMMKPDLVYRLDKIEKRTNVDIERVVLARLMIGGDPRCDQVRRLILDSKMEPKDDIYFEEHVLVTGWHEVVELDKKEQKSVVRTAATDNYFILNERIGFTKCKLHKTISALVRLILDVGRNVLIVAPTIDSLVDLMRRLQSKMIKFIIIDDGQKSAEARSRYKSNFIKVPQGDGLDLNKKFDSYIKQHEMSKVVISTYGMSIGGLQFTRRIFDYCICYDCDTTEILVSLSPMFCSDRVIILDVNEDKGNDASVDERHCDSKSFGENITLGAHLRATRPELYQENFKLTFA